MLIAPSCSMQFDDGALYDPTKAADIPRLANSLVDVVSAWQRRIVGSLVGCMPRCLCLLAGLVAGRMASWHQPLTIGAPVDRIACSPAFNCLRDAPLAVVSMPSRSLCRLQRLVLASYMFSSFPAERDLPARARLRLDH